MSAAQIHPEDLIDRSRSGVLDEAEQRLLDVHLAECPACRFELAAGPGLYTQVKLDAGDDAMIAGVLARVARNKMPVSARPRRRTLPIVAAVVTAFVAGAAAASVGVHAWRKQELKRQAVTQAPVAAEPPVVEASPVVKPAAPPTVTPEASPTRLAPPKPATVRRAVVAADPGCADRFRRANELRRAGETREALRQYRDLRRGCAGSSEELLARVLSGRIHLDQLDQPASALAAFDDYLRANPEEALREEALIGRALALGRLQRFGEEARAWRALIAAYPDSLYAARARSRIETLER